MRMTLNTVRKVNLGCGTTIAPGWINIDASPNIWLSRHSFLKSILYRIGLLSEVAYKIKWPEGIIYHDVRKGLPLEDNSVDYIYTSHMLGHVEEYEAIAIIKDCYRVLKPGGYIRIVVSDLKFYVSKYIKNELTAKELLYALGIGCSPPTSISKLFLYRFEYRTKWLYDFQSLSYLLETSGFKKVMQKRFREGKVPDIEVLDNREEISLFVEAEK